MNKIDINIFGVSLAAEGLIAVMLVGLIALVVLLHLWMVASGRGGKRGGHADR